MIQQLSVVSEGYSLEESRRRNEKVKQAKFDMSKTLRNGDLLFPNDRVLVKKYETPKMKAVREIRIAVIGVIAFAVILAFTMGPKFFNIALYLFWVPALIVSAIKGSHLDARKKSITLRKDNILARRIERNKEKREIELLEIEAYAEHDLLKEKSLDDEFSSLVALGMDNSYMDDLRSMRKQQVEDKEKAEVKRDNENYLLNAKAKNKAYNLRKKVRVVSKKSTEDVLDLVRSEHVELDI